MGGGNWNTQTYTKATQTRRVSGEKDFGYDDDVRRGRASGIHKDLDPKEIVKTVMGVREARDSAEHPNSIPIMIAFDVTGSMHDIPRVMQQKLPKLMDVILEKTDIKDPQILMSAIGDYHSDRYPVQIGQFESDNRFDEQLRKIILEGNGGGQRMESYGHAFYTAARLTASDAWEKRNKKGYLFTIGDEKFWPELTARELNDIYGVGAEASEMVEDLIAEAMEQWEVFHIVPTNTGYNGQFAEFWRDHLGERVITLDDATLVCETIASTIRMIETAETAEQAVADVGLRGQAGKELAAALSGLASVGTAA